MQQAAQVYGQVARKALAPRDLEAQLLIKAAAMLQSVRDAEELDRDALDEALTYNRRLWTILSTSATKRENPLPADIKNNIATLAVFILRETVQVQISRSTSQLTTLISINRDIAAGLRARAEAQQADQRLSLSAASGISAQF